MTDLGHIRSGAPYGFRDDCVIALALSTWLLKRSACRPSIPVGPILFVVGVEWRPGDIDL